MSNILVNNEVVKWGESKILKLDVARLPSGTKIHLHINVYRSEKPGPTLMVIAGVHGDEINGVEIVRRAIEDGMFNQLDAGSVIVVPLLNIYGFINFSRDLPDGKDVNRSFPGSKYGSLAARVAYTLTQEVLPDMDVGVDFHTGGKTRYNFPQIRYTKGHEESEKLAKVFGAPFMIANKPIAKSLRKVSIDKGKPMLVFEGGESLRWDDDSIMEGITGLKRLMTYMGLKQFDVPPPAEAFTFTSTGWIRAPRSGLFIWHKKSGAPVRPGDVLGEINDPYGLKTSQIKAKKEGYIIGHNNAAVVSQGEALFHIGYMKL